MFKATKAPAVRPEAERETVLDLRFYLSLSRLTARRLQAVQSAALEKSHKDSKKLSLLLLFHSIQEQITKITAALRPGSGQALQGQAPCRS